MGTITARKRADGITTYTAQIRLKSKGVIVHSEAQSFSRKVLAQAWMKRREAELEVSRAVGAMVHNKKTVADLLRVYVDQAKGVANWGRTKTADIARLKASKFAERDARFLTAADIIEFVKSRRVEDGVAPSTVLNDVIWLRQVFLTAETLFGLKQPLEAVDSAKRELLRTRVIAKPRRRTRRLSIDEESRLLAHFERRDMRSKIPMAAIMRFAILTARRQEEICLIRWADLDVEAKTCWLDDVKHPTQKIGNRRCFRILQDAMNIIEQQPRTAPEIFPFNHRSVGSAFTRACHFLGIEDLHFHDLRHEATSRLFERKYSIPEVTQFTLHESWSSLQIYTHLDPADVPER